MILVIVLVSSIVILNPIDYLSLMESYLFLIYPSLLQFSMIRRVFPNGVDVFVGKSFAAHVKDFELLLCELVPYGVKQVSLAEANL